VAEVATKEDDVQIIREGLSFKRFFTTEGVHPFDQVEWERRDAVIPNYKEGGNAFEQRDVEFPASWSQNATNIVAQKYFRGTLGTPQRIGDQRTVTAFYHGAYRAAGGTEAAPAGPFIWAVDSLGPGKIDGTVDHGGVAEGGGSTDIGGTVDVAVDQTVDVQQHDGHVTGHRSGNSPVASILYVHLDDGRDVEAFSHFRVAPPNGAHVVVARASPHDDPARR